MSGPRKKLLQVFMSEEEYERVAVAAQAVGLSRSAFVRRAVTLAEQRLNEVRLIPAESARELWRD